MTALVCPIGGLPADLQRQVDSIRRGGSHFPGTDPDDPGMRLPPDDSYHPAANAFLTAYRELDRAPERTVVKAWLTRLAFGVANVPSEDEMRGRFSSVWTVCHMLPHGVWSEETLIEALQTFRFWPAAAEVYALLKPHADRIRSTVDALTRIASNRIALPPPPAEPAAPSDEEMAAVRRIVSAFTAEVQAMPTEPKPTPKPLHLTPAQMLIEYERLAKQGAPGAALRVQMLRKQIAAALNPRPTGAAVAAADRPQPPSAAANPSTPPAPGSRQPTSSAPSAP